jgi:hypothetical protein
MLTVIPWFGQALFRLGETVRAQAQQEAADAPNYDFLLRQDNAVLTGPRRTDRAGAEKIRGHFVPRVLTAGLY